MRHFFWDSCVIASYLNQDASDSDLPSLNRFILDAKGGICLMYASSITMAEILPSYLEDKKFTSYEKFLADMEGSFRLIPPSPNILTLSARLRDIQYSKVVTKKEITFRKLDVPDAVMLATAIVLQEGYGVTLDGFHTYDNGKKRSVDGGKCVPLLDYPDWCERLNQKQKAVANRVIALPICKPVHPTPEFPFGK